MIPTTHRPAGRPSASPGKSWLPAVFAAAVLAVSARGVSVVPPTFSQLVGRAEQIVQIQVTGTHAQWDTSPDGHRIIHTYVDCRVEDALKGGPAQTLELRFLGGTVGSDHLVVSDMPVLEVGGEYLLFVAQNQRAFCPLVNVMHGSYRVWRDPGTGERYVTRHNGEPLRTVADVSLPPGAHAVTAAAPAMTLGDFRSAILAELGGAHAK